MSKFAQMYARTGVALGTLAMVVGSGKAFADTPVFDENSTLTQGNTSLDSSTLTDTGIKGFIANLANQALGIVLMISGVVAIFYLIYSGFQYVTSAGNPDKVKTARQGIINAIIGIVIIVSAFFIVRFAGLLGTTVGNADQATTP